MAFSQVEIVAQQIEKERRGYQAVSLTHFADTSEPQIAAGSVVELGDSLFEADANEAIAGLGAIANGSQVHVKLVPTGSAPVVLTPTATITAPTWSTTKQGWYNGLERYIGGLYKDAGGNYTKKWFYEEKGGIWFKRYGDGTVEVIGAVTFDGAVTFAVAIILSGGISGNLSVGGSIGASGEISAESGNAKLSSVIGSYTTGTLSVGGTYTVPSGTYYAMSGANTNLEIYAGGAWRPLFNTLIYSNGSSLRFKAASGTTGSWMLIKVGT